MFSKVRVRKGALDYFRKLARKSFPYEIQCYLLGNIKSVNEIEITDFVYPKEYHTQTRGSVCWLSEEFDTLNKRAELEGKRVVGDAHTHPDWDAVLSPTDYESAIKNCLLVCGVCSVSNGRTRFRFWTPTSALPCKIITY